MSAIDPLHRRGQGPGRLRTIDTIARAGEEESAGSRVAEPEHLKCSYRPADADFYCWKYGVWYNLMDCCYRHERQTYPGCTSCGQGHGNLRANRARYAAIRPRRDRSTDR